MSLSTSFLRQSADHYNDLRIGGFRFDRLAFVVGTEPGTHVAGEGVDCLEGIGGDRLDELGRDFCSL